MDKQEHTEVVDKQLHDFINELKPEEARHQTPHTLSKIRFILLVVGLALSVFVLFLESIMVSVTLPVIVSEFNAMGQIARVAVAGHLTSTAMQPLNGKKSDIFGRKPIFIIALTSYLIGIILSGASQNLSMFMIARVFNGIGSGGIFTLNVTIISDLVPLKDRPIYMTMTGVIYAIAEILGPVLSGALTDNLSWRWIFYVAIPLCVVATLLVLSFLNLPHLQKQGDVKEKVRRVDFPGIATLASAIICLVLALSWGGKEFQWNEWQILLPLVLSIALLTVFMLIELRLAKEPIIPFNIFNRNTIIGMTINFFHGVLGMSCGLYIPLYYQVLHRLSVTEAGIRYLPYLMSNVFGNIISGFLMTKTGAYRPVAWAGTISATIGIVLLGSLMRADITLAEGLIIVALIGFGIGLCYHVNTIMPQAAAKEENVASVTSVIVFSNMLGGVFGVAVQGAIFTSSLTSALTPLLPSLDIETVTSSIHNIRALPIIDQLAVNTGYSQALRTLFLATIPTAVIPLLATLFLRHIPLRDK